MIEWLVSYALRKRVIVGMVCLFTAIFGYYSWTQLAVEAYPDIAEAMTRVITQAPGLAAEEVEQQVTIPLERELNGTPGLLMMRSKTTFGLSLITLVFRDGVETYWSRQRILERLQNVTLPPDLAPSLDPVSSPTGQLYYYTLESGTKGLRELSELQKWIIVPALKQVPGVADVGNFGGITTQFQLQLDPQQLMRFNLSLKNVTDAITANSSSSGGSVVARGDLGYVVRGVGLVQTLEDMGDIVVTQRNGTPILVRDLGKLKLSNQERHGILRKNDKNDVIEGVVLLLKGENPSRVMVGVHAKVDELNDRLKLEGVQIVPYIDWSNLVDATVDKVSHTIFMGIGLVLIVLILFLGSIRSALIVAVTIPFAMAVTFTMMYFTNIPANLLSLGAIDFGIIVDGAIVITDAILRRREAKPSEFLTEEDAREAAHQVARPTFFATLIIITAYLPLFAFQRVEAKLFHPMVYAVGYVQLGALLLVLTLVPALAYLVFRKPQRTFRNPAIEWLEGRYPRVLGHVLCRPFMIFGLSAGAVVAVVWLGTTIPREFLPELDEGSIWLHAELPGGISLATANRMVVDLRDAVREFPEVSNIIIHVGRNDDGTDPWTPSHVEAGVGLRPYSDWPSGGSKRELIQRMAARFRQLGGIEIAFSQPIIDTIIDKLVEPHAQLSVRVFGDDYREMRRIAGDAVEVLRTVPGASDVEVDQQPPLPQIVIKVDREAAARYGINVSDITDLIEIGIGGGAVTQLFIGDRRYDATVRFPEAARNSPEAIGGLLLASTGGALVPLSQVATIRRQTGESTITHEMTQRYVLVKLNYRDRDVPSLVAEAKQTIAKRVTFDPKRYRIEWGGEFEKQQRAEARFKLIVGLMLAVMSVLLFAEFGVFRQVLLILGVVPLATLGGLIALHITGTTLNVASGVGFIALFGVAVLNAVIMVANLNRHRDMGQSLYEAVLAGAGERLRPVLMTASVATVGMLPAAMATGVGSDVQRGVATIVAGGLLIATLLTLFVIPTFYFVFERWALRRVRGGAAQTTATLGSSS
jgi:cobalt-zinc-cadmium resistance protein CzcA